jgi:hypothetical protein
MAQSSIQPPQAFNFIRISAGILGLSSGLIAAYSGAVIGYVSIGHNQDSPILVQLTIIAWFAFCGILWKKGLGFSIGVLSAISISVIVMLVALTADGEFAGKAIISGLGLGGGIGSILGLATAVSLTSRKKLTLLFCFPR